MYSLKNLSYYHGADPREGSRSSGGVRIDDLQIASSGVSAIIGPSGSGKTTLLSVLSGFLKPSVGKGGHFFFGKKDLTKEGYKPGEVGFVFQSHMLLGPASGALNMLQGFVAAGRSDLDLGQARDLLEKLGLTSPEKPLLGKRSRHLSGGERQRFAVARAILADPAAILCDEPTSSLDETNAESVMSALKNWSNDGNKPVIWVTHNMQQAAEHAEHYVFLSRGEIVAPPEVIQKALKSDSPEERIKALQSFVPTLGQQSNQALGETGNTELGGERAVVSRLAFQRWIARALSTDGPPSTVLADGRLETQNARGLRKLIAKLEPPFAGPHQFWRSLLSGFGRLIEAALGYSRYGLALILFVLLVQIALADFAKRAVEDFSQARLQDPAVSRIVFEHDARNEENANAMPLFQGNIQLLEDRILSALTSGEVATERPAVAIFGRRSVDGISYRFPDAPVAACQSWFYADTVSLDLEDPLLNQTAFTQNLGGHFVRGSQEFVALAQDRGRQTGTTPKLMVLQDSYAQNLAESCGMDLSEPLRVEAAITLAERAFPVEFRVAGFAERWPPLHPLLPQILILDSDFGAMADMSEGAPPQAPRVANAYFPIEAFDQVEAVLRQERYIIKDDSRAAVKTLQNIEGFANYVPPVLIFLNIAAMVTIFVVVLQSILEIIKRVLALFRAFGFTLYDTLMVLGIHLMPAILTAYAGLVVFITISWKAATLFLGEATMTGLSVFRNEALIWTVSVTTFVSLAAILAVVWFWWWVTGSRLATYLQE